MKQENEKALSSYTIDFLSILLLYKAMEQQEIDAWTFEYPENHDEECDLSEFTVWDFDDYFVEKLEDFIEGFIAILCSKGIYGNHTPLNRSFGENIYFSLSGHGVGFFDEGETGKEIQEILEKYAGNKNKFEHIDLYVNDLGKLSLDYKTEFLKDRVDELFSHN